MDRTTWALVIALVVSADARAGQADQQPDAEQPTWKWSDDGTNPLNSALHFGGHFQVEFIRPPGESRSLMIRFSDGEKEVYAWKGHPHSVFVGRGRLLYYAEFYPDATGCTIVAVDLNTRKRLWKTRLRGIEQADHSQYRNRINLEFYDKFIVIYGNESHGRYIELLDLETGRTAGHKVIQNSKGNGS